MFKPVRTDLLTLCLCITLVNNYYSLANPGSSSSSSRQQVLEELHVNISRSISTVQAILSQKQNQSELCQEQSNSQYRNLTLDRSGNNNESVDYSIKLFHGEGKCTSKNVTAAQLQACVAERGDPHGPRPPHFFLGGPGPPLFNFEFCLSKFNKSNFAFNACDVTVVDSNYKHFL